MQASKKQDEDKTFYVVESKISTDDRSEHLGLIGSNKDENELNIKKKISLRASYSLIKTGVHGSNPKTSYKIYQVYAVPWLLYGLEVNKGTKIRNRYNQVPHLTQDTNGKVTNSQLDTTNESQEVSPFPAGDHKAHINRRAQRHSKHKKKKHKRSTKEVSPWNGQ